MAMKATMAAPAPPCPSAITTTAKAVSRRIARAITIRLKRLTPPFSQPGRRRWSRVPGPWVVRLRTPGPAVRRSQPPFRSGVNGAEAAHPALVVDDRLVEVAAAHVGPERLGEDQLAVGDLPQQEIRDACLA